MDDEEAAASGCDDPHRMRPLAPDEVCGRYESWAAAYDAFHARLLQDRATCAEGERPPTFSSAYWSHRTLAVIQNFDNMSFGRVGFNEAGVRQNPQAAMGVPGTSEVNVAEGEQNLADELDSGDECESSRSDGSSAVVDVDDAHVHIAEDEERAAARFPASWFLVEKLARGNGDFLPGVHGSSQAVDIYRSDFCWRNDKDPQSRPQQLLDGVRA